MTMKILKALARTPSQSRTKLLNDVWMAVEEIIAALLLPAVTGRGHGNKSVGTCRLFANLLGFCAILPHVIIYYDILSYTMLFYAILSYTIIYCHILSYTETYFFIEEPKGSKVDQGAIVVVVAVRTDR